MRFGSTSVATIVTLGTGAGTSAGEIELGESDKQANTADGHMDVTTLAHACAASLILPPHPPSFVLPLPVSWPLLPPGCIKRVEQGEQDVERFHRRNHALWYHHHQPHRKHLHLSRSDCEELD
eukprot:CAMPEP_0179470590 /NCGR_PEP_ID=MMETSP0799-20121207/51010_1 /TAXON_ID=46947 /ORGANISM="Geminigera cryophila, Strain CCMP2564" /LENGTH=122 /DNA_ID=CAMNT_0021277733 /DNA_START=508 /DNA_END=873 /DNA_ORIENTATION=+